MGIDNVAGYVTSLEGVEKEPVPTVLLTSWRSREVFVLDVREKGTRSRAHPRSTQLYGGRVMWRLDELPRDRTIVIHCQTGSRSAGGRERLAGRGLRRSGRAGGQLRGLGEGPNADGQGIEHERRTLCEA